MHKIYFISISLIAFLMLFSSTGIYAKAQDKTIGMIIPIEHEAMGEIIRGFKDTLEKDMSLNSNIIIRNASGDTNLQRAIIQELKTRQADLFVPVSTNSTLMTLTMVYHTPIVSIASNYTQKQRARRKPCNIAAVNDSIPPSAQIKFIQKIIPELKHITVVHSASDKIVQEVNTFLNIAKKNNLSVQNLMIQTLSDLYSMTHKISPKSQLIFIFKDNLVASGIRTLVQQANYFKIPLITSDDGTVKQGAALGLGIREYELGVLGGQMAIQLLHDQDPCHIPISMVKHLSVFLNTTAALKQGLTKRVIQNAASQVNYTLVDINSAR
jgi:putative ABC transport system substrate-binding protein